MSDHDNAVQDTRPEAGFWRSRPGIALIVFAVIAAVLLEYEHRIHLFAGGLFPLVLLLGCVVMHFFMHGSHGAGGHGAGGHGGHSNEAIGDKGDKP